MPSRAGGKDPVFWAFNRSLPVDKRLFAEDIQGSIAHVRMLGRRRIVPPAEARRIERELRRVRERIASGRFRFRAGDEDIHMAVERALMAALGPAGGRLHTARSRNDQVALDARLFLRGAVRRLARDLADLVAALVRKARPHLRTLMPAYTHLQRGQVTTVAHHLAAYGEMFLRDLSRLRDLLPRIETMPLGAGACTGTTFPIDRVAVARSLGFATLSRNSLDAVSDRDFLMEFQGVAAILAVHLSRLGEEIVLWTTSEFGFAVLPSALTTGSSMMPNKRNPDGAELLRGKAGRVFGNLVQILTVMKGLPLAYNKDLQEDKEGLFDTVDTLSGGVAVARRMVAGLSFRTDVLRRAVEEGAGWILATEAADLLARRGIPFRRAHGIVKAWVDEARRTGRPLSAFTAAQLRAISPQLTPDLPKALSVDRAVARRTLPGGPAPAAVSRALRLLARDARRLLRDILRRSG